MADIFVSYSKSNKPIVGKLVRQLEQLGYTVWWDDRITPKKSWDKVVEMELDACKVVLACWTPAAYQSEWVRLEAGYGKDNDKLVPAMLIDCDIPLAFRHTQWADLTNWNQSDSGYSEFQRLLGWLDGWIPRPVAVAEPEPRPAPPPPSQPAPAPEPPKPAEPPKVPAAEFIKQDNSKFLESNEESNEIPPALFVAVAVFIVALIIFAGFAAS